MKVRADRLVVEQGLAPTREKAQALILAGKVYRGEIRVDKAGTLLLPETGLTLRGKACPYVSRGGLKLRGALEDCGLAVEGLVCADIGASTGGFTDCLLQAGAKRVYAVDVGRGQLDAKLRGDERVVNHERLNARYLEESFFPEPIDLVTIDVSFISLKLILPAVHRSAPGARVMAMVKPQFEAGRDRVGKGGVVRDESVRRAVVEAIEAFAAELAYTCSARADSRLKGPKGNVETFLFLEPETG